MIWPSPFLVAAFAFGPIWRGAQKYLSAFSSSARAGTLRVDRMAEQASRDHRLDEAKRDVGRQEMRGKGPQSCFRMGSPADGDASPGFPCTSCVARVVMVPHITSPRRPRYPGWRQVQTRFDHLVELTVAVTSQPFLNRGGFEPLPSSPIGKGLFEPIRGFAQCGIAFVRSVNDVAATKSTRAMKKLPLHEHEITHAEGSGRKQETPPDDAGQSPHGI